ncbi:spiroplasma phage ORF1-like family protein [Spiroplasma endosymbiont of Ammophila pubescens]|uniref:spiroplasma phage ORF1-like family protein n=1 Tax=Spiroplasma endosymbiont of Ammophila pubescens TaxID=3066315 RepID=UPI0032B2D565
MKLQQKHQSQQTAKQIRIKRSVETGINETDFINTMFLRSTFFENWSETNYFINPTLKTTQSLTYNDKWYLDFLKDSYSTGISFDKPSDKFMDLYKNWDSYVKQYNINKFYDVDRKQFLRELINFAYSFTNKYNLTQMLNKLKTNINNLQSVNLIEDNWKLVNDYNSFVFNIDNKFYFFVFQPFNSKQWKILKFKHDTNNAKEIDGIPFIPSDIKVYVEMSKLKGLYYWDRVGEPQKPTINPNTGEIINWSVENQNKVKDFLNNYLDVIIQENIRVQQGGNLDYDDPNLGSQRIIFDFEIVDNMEKSVKGNILTKKSIYRMILTIDKDNSK